MIFSTPNVGHYTIHREEFMRYDWTQIEMYYFGYYVGERCVEYTSVRR